MKRLLIIFVLFLILNPSGSNAGQEKQVTGSITMIYDRSVNQNNDVLIELQINFNMSSLEIVLDQGVDKIVIFSALYDTWIIGDWIDTSVDKQYIPHGGKYSGRVIAKPQNVNDTIDTLFFEFVVYRILTIAEGALATGIIMIILVLPFVLDKQKEKAEKYTWNKLTYRQFLSLSVSKLYSKLRALIFVMMVIDGLIIVGGLLFIFLFPIKVPGWIF